MERSLHLGAPAIQKKKLVPLVIIITDKILVSPCPAGVQHVCLGSHMKEQKQKLWSDNILEGTHTK